MPEGDSLVRVADRLRPVLAGRTLLRTDFRVPQLATADLAGRTVEAVWPRAKYLVMEAGDRSILSHLKMEGHWDVHPLAGPDGAALRPRWHSPGWQARCVLETSAHEVVGFQLGMLEVVPTAVIGERLGFLGPDLLDPGWADPEVAAGLLAEGVRRLAAEPDRPIGVALLDQRLVSGIGNIYRCETLLLAGLDPHRPVSAVPDLPGLVLLARDLMRVNTGPGPRGTTGVLRDDSAPYGIRVRTAPGGPGSGGVPGRSGAGRYAADGPPAAAGPGAGRGRGADRRSPHYWVYGRARHGCYRCGGPVAVEQLGDARAEDRTLHWCPRCQR